MNDVRRTYALPPSEPPAQVERPSLEGMISVLTDKVEFACKQIDDLHSRLDSVLYPVPPLPAVDTLNKLPSPVVPQSIERLESLCRKLDKINANINTIQSCLCL